jgi:hypothetical protein
MSGGSMNHLYSRLEEAAENIRNGLTYTGEPRDYNPMRVKLAELMEHVAAALYNIEMVDSSDIAPGSEFDSIRAAFKFARETKIYVSDEGVIKNDAH